MNSGERVRDVPTDSSPTTGGTGMSNQSKQTAHIHPTNKAVMRLSQDGKLNTTELSGKETYTITDKLSRLYLVKLKT